MSIYADKKNGKPTGRWRVELQRKGFATYKKRWDTFAEAEKDQKAVMAAWERGEAVGAPGAAPGAPKVHTLATVIPQARGVLWAGLDTETLCWQRMDLVAKLLGPHTKLDDIDTQAVDGLIRKLKAAGKSDGTCNRYLSHLNTFLTWAKSRKYRTAPVKGEDGIAFSWKKESQGRIRWITHEEQQAIGEYLTSRTHESADQASAVWDLIQVAIETGCRRDELLTVEPGQLNGNRLHLWETKTDTPRTIPLSPATAARLRSLLEPGRMPSQRGLRSWWERVRAHMGLSGDADFVFHACRHTCATRMVDADINVFVIKEWMGHKVMETTLRYAHVKPKNLEDALVKVGEHLRLVVNNPQNTGEESLPLTSPTGGVTAPLAVAA